MKRKTLLRKGSAYPMALNVMESIPSMYSSHVKEGSQEHELHENEARTPRRDGPHQENPSYPDALFREFMGGASAVEAYKRVYSFSCIV